VAVAATVVAGTAERRNLNGLRAEHHMRKTEAPANQAAVAETTLDVFGRGIGGDVEILRVSAEQQIAHCTADQVSGEAGFVQAIQHAQRTAGNVLARDGVLFARDDAQVRHGRIGNGILIHSLRL
jgi:hypothetical protein